MAQEISITASLTVYKPSVMTAPVGRSVTTQQFTMTGNVVFEGTALVGTSATPVGGVTGATLVLAQEHRPDQLRHL